MRSEIAMKLKTPLSLGLLVGSSLLCLVGYADDHYRAPRPAPPPFQAHPAGVHPHGPIVRPHPIRVLAPKPVVHGRSGWTHWEHPEFTRPVYYWNWQGVHNVTCIAEDSYGDQYPVTEAAAPGFGLSNMTDVEDDALDRCYSESGQDSTCYLATCTHI
jgi:hypothetical protein